MIPRKRYLSILAAITLGTAIGAFLFFNQFKPELSCIDGVVVDLEGNYQKGLTISIISGTAPFPEIAATTNSDGYIKMCSIRKGTYTVAAHRNGTQLGIGEALLRGWQTGSTVIMIPR
jgi:hypothetical protein